MRVSNVAVVCVLILVMLGSVQLNFNLSYSWAAGVINSLRSGHDNQNNRLWIKVKENDPILSMKISFENLNAVRHANTVRHAHDETMSHEGNKMKGSESSMTTVQLIVKTGDSANFDAPDSIMEEMQQKMNFAKVEFRQERDKNATVKIDERIRSESTVGNTSISVGSTQSISLTNSNKIIRFHLIMTRYVVGTSILNFNRPPEIFYAMYNYRHRRVLESIFYHHPNADVTIHTNFMNDSDFAPFIDAGYSIRTMPLRFEELAVGTPLEGATRSPKWKEWEQGKHWYTCFSDLYRLIVIWTLGGVYMDTDMVITRPFEGLDKAVGFQDKSRAFLNCAMIVFKKPGSPFIWKCMEEVAAHYDGEVWGANGPMLLTRVWRGWKNRTERNAAIRVQGQTKFYLFYHRDAKHHCFNNSMTGERRLAYAKALAARAPYAVHMSNKMTWLVKKDLIPGTFCHYLFTRYCVFCDAYPAKPPSYPAIDEGEEHVELP